MSSKDRRKPEAEKKERPKETPEAIASMRNLFPLFVDLLQQKHIQDSLLIQQKMVNWDEINAIERECGLPETPCPDSPVTKRGEE